MAAEAILVSGSRLENLLGIGNFYVVEVERGGAQVRLNYRCGCLAIQHDLSRFEVFACPGHRSTFAFAEDRNTSRTPEPD